MKKILILCIAAVLSALSFLNGQEKAQFDKNFREAKVGKLEVHYYNALNKPFELNGFPWRRADGELNRLPETANKKKYQRICPVCRTPHQRRYCPVPYGFPVYDDPCILPGVL